MTSLHTTTLLNEPAAPPMPQHSRSVTHVVPQPMPMQVAPQPQYVIAQPSQGGSAVAAIMLALLVVLLGAVALVGAYYATTQSSPSAREATLTQEIALRGGFQNGRVNGVVTGRDQALANASTTLALRAAAARERAYAAAYRRGVKAGRSSYRPARSSYGGGYRAPRYGTPRNADLYSAFGTAQALANATGAPVDVELYR